MNDLEHFFQSNTGRLIQKWSHYFEIYDRHLARFRGTEVHIVEFGVFQGGSLRMWKDYFGPQAKIYGVDINPLCKAFEEDGVRIFIGDQQDREFLRSLKAMIPQIDILIDDGGHTMRQQISTYEELFPSVSPNGVYLCEDLHTSYWTEYGGGFRRAGTFIEYSKRLVDRLNAWHSRDKRRLAVNEFTRSARSMHYYDSVLVIEKQPIKEPVNLRTGFSEIPNYEPQASFLERLHRFARRRF